MKKVYLSLFLHGNMCYDRYTKQVIRGCFPGIYATGIRAMHRFPQVTAHIDFPGLTTLSLKHDAPWFLEELKPLIERGQVVMAGCQYAASHAMCSDEESDLVASRVGMEIMRDEIDPAVSAFFPQEWPFHPQSPYIVRQIGATRTFVMNDAWERPHRVRGLDGSEVLIYARDRLMRLANLETTLEAYYDRHEDGAFLFAGGDFEDLGNVGRIVAKMEELAAKGKVIDWMTIDRYEREIGAFQEYQATVPFGRQDYDTEPSPSFSRWVSDAEDIRWHGHAVVAMDAIRSAGFANVAARLYDLGVVDVPLEQAWTTPPDNPWDEYFEHVGEYPETEARYLSLDGRSTLLSRAWHHLIIGLNSDASGFNPWQPRTRHRKIAMDTARALSEEVLLRFARQVAPRLRPPTASAERYVLALNPLAARSATVSLPTAGPMALVEADGAAIETATTLQDGQWLAQARVELPAYGYKLLGLTPTERIASPTWEPGDAVTHAGREAALRDGELALSEGAHRVTVSLAPFRLSDPAGIAETEEVAPHWGAATTRVRHTTWGPDLEVFTELAWAMWLRLIVGLRADHVAVTAEVYADMPRRVGNLAYHPNGLLLEFQGAPGSIYYDVPYGTVRHGNPESSFIAAQRFVALEGEDASLGLIALGGNQSFRVAADEGAIAAGLGASKAGRPDTRPQCVVHPDGTGVHVVSGAGDPLLGTYEHRFALTFAGRAETARLARELRTGVPLLPVAPGAGDWPTAGSLLAIEPETAYVTAFRVTREGCELVVNDLSGEAGTVTWRAPLDEQEHQAPLSAYGIVTLRP